MDIGRNSKKQIDSKNTTASIPAAFEQIKKKADSNPKDHMAQLYVAKSYLDINNDPQKALPYLQKASAQNNLEANHLLGNLYWSGAVVNGKASYISPSDPIKAVTILKKGADAGYVESQYIAGYMYRYGGKAKNPIPSLMADEKLCLLYFEKAAEQNHPKALHELVEIYISGLKTVKPDEKKTIPLLQKIMEREPADILLKHSQDYAIARGINNNARLSFLYCEAAAKKGNVQAVFFLAEKYKKGLGTQKNLNLAVEIYENIIDHSDNAQDILQAKKHLLNLFSTGEDTGIDAIKTAFYFRSFSLSDSKEMKKELDEVLPLLKINKKIPEVLYHSSLAIPGKLNRLERIKPPDILFSLFKKDLNSSLELRKESILKMKAFFDKLAEKNPLHLSAPAQQIKAEIGLGEINNDFKIAEKYLKNLNPALLLPEQNNLIGEGIYNKITDLFITLKPEEARLQTKDLYSQAYKHLREVAKFNYEDSKRLLILIASSQLPDSERPNYLDYIKVNIPLPESFDQFLTEFIKLVQSKEVEEKIKIDAKVRNEIEKSDAKNEAANAKKITDAFTIATREVTQATKSDTKITSDVKSPIESFSSNNKSIYQGSTVLFSSAATQAMREPEAEEEFVRSVLKKINIDFNTLDIGIKNNSKFTYLKSYLNLASTGVTLEVYQDLTNLERVNAEISRLLQDKEFNLGSPKQILEKMKLTVENDIKIYLNPAANTKRSNG